MIGIGKGDYYEESSDDIGSYIYMHPNADSLRRRRGPFCSAKGYNLIYHIRHTRDSGAEYGRTHGSLWNGSIILDTDDSYYRSKCKPGIRSSP